MSLILASASPRRAQLLAQLGVQFRVTPADIDETVKQGEPAIAYTQRMAHEKAQRVIEHRAPSIAVLAADTVVCIGDQIFSKPRDQCDAMAMWAALADQRHCVMTSFELRYGATTVAETCQTDVWLAAMSEAQQIAYWHTGEPQDKAGAYAIQGNGAQFVARIEGSYSNVVGLPLYELANALRAAGLCPLNR